MINDLVCIINYANNLKKKSSDYKKYFIPSLGDYQKRNILL